MLPRVLPFCIALSLILSTGHPVSALDGRAILGAAAKMSGPAGWSDRRSIVSIETRDESDESDEVRVRRAEMKESLGEDLKISSISEFLGPADVLGLRLLDVWSPDDIGDAWIWAPQTRRTQRITAGLSDDTSTQGNEPGYRTAQLLDVLPRMAEDIDVRVVDEETVDGVDMVVLDVDVGERDWSLGRKFRVWVSTDDSLLRKLEARSSTGAVSRRVTVRTYAEADGRPTPIRVEVETPATKQKTVFVRSDVQYDRGIPPRVFSLRDLSKGR